MFSFQVATSALLRLFRRSDRSGTARWRTRLFHGWARGLVRVLGIRVEVRGEPPKPPFFLVSNHLSYIDVIVLASSVPCVCVSKADVAGWPIIGTLCRSADTLFIDRESKRDILRVMQQIAGTLAGGRGVVVFPEGSSTCGAEVQRFRPPLLEAAATAELPVSYAALTYRTPPGSAPAHLAVCWWGDMTFGNHLLNLLGLPAILAGLTFGERPITERNRKELAERLRFAVASRFEPVVSVEQV